MMGKRTLGCSGFGGGSIGNRNGGIGRGTAPPPPTPPPPPPPPNTATTAATTTANTATAATAATNTTATATATATTNTTATAATNTTATAATADVGAQEPVVREVAGVKPAPEQIVVRCAGPQFASGRVKLLGVGSRAVDRLNQSDAVTVARVSALPAEIRHYQRAGGVGKRMAEHQKVGVLHRCVVQLRIEQYPAAGLNEACAASIVKTLNGDPAGCIARNVQRRAGLQRELTGLPPCPLCRPCRIALPEFTAKLVLGALTP